jgi:D-alanyl-D-alanine carboxypeptidase (penicillin-binding protein 5/6)
VVADDLNRDVHLRRHGHGERHGLSRTAEERLAALDRQLPPLPEAVQLRISAHRVARRRRQTVLVLGALLVLVLGALSVVQWLRPVPQPALEETAASIRVPGTAPQLPWPSAGEAALAVQGLGGFEQMRGDQPAPFADISSVLTAYVVLKDHPLATGGATGPAIPVSPSTLASFETGSALGLSEVTVVPGETLTELDALEGLLVNSGSDMAPLLADWDAGNTHAFVDKMNAAARALGMSHTEVSGPSAARPDAVSTPTDLIRLGEAAMGIPVFRQIVSLGQTILPLNGLRYNPNFDLGQDGIIGIVTGSNSATDGGYLFAAQKTLNGKTATVYGVVLGQFGPQGPETAAVDAGDALAKAALAAVTVVPILPAGHRVATLAAPWGSSAPVAVAEAVSIMAWPGLTVPATMRLLNHSTPIAARSTIGTLAVGAGPNAATSPLESTAPVTGPSATWRLTR